MKKTTLWLLGTTILPSSQLQKRAQIGNSTESMEHARTLYTNCNAIVHICIFVATYKLISGEKLIFCMIFITSLIIVLLK